MSLYFESGSTLKFKGQITENCLFSNSDCEIVRAYVTDSPSKIRLCLIQDIVFVLQFRFVAFDKR